MAINTSLQSIVNDHRKAAKLSRQELALMAGVGKTVIYDIEHGKTSIRFDTLNRILDCLNIQIIFDSPLKRQVRLEKG